jgi:hypothetical protein
MLTASAVLTIGGGAAAHLASAAPAPRVDRSSPAFGEQVDNCRALTARHPNPASFNTHYEPGAPISAEHADHEPSVCEVVGQPGRLRLWVRTLAIYDTNLHVERQGRASHVFATWSGGDHRAPWLPAPAVTTGGAATVTVTGIVSPADPVVTYLDAASEDDVTYDDCNAPCVTASGARIRAR